MQTISKETKIAKLEAALDLAWQDVNVCLRNMRVSSKLTGKAVAQAQKIEAQILELEPNYYEIKLAALNAENN